MDDKTKFVLGVVLSVGIVLRGYFLLNYELIDGRQYHIFLSDEAVVGLMGKHIAAGVELPLFFYGQQYLGAFEAYLAALSFSIFGISMVALKLVPLMFSIMLLFVVYLLGTKLFDPRVGVVSAALIAVPSPYFFGWGFKARGGFIEYVVLSLIVLLLFSLIYFHRKDSFWLYGLWGFFAGFSLWVNQLILPFLALLALYAWFKSPALLSGARLWVLLVTFVVGASPLIISNVLDPFVTFRILARKGLDVRGDVSRLDYQDKVERIVGGLAERVVEVPDLGQNLAILFGFQGSVIEEPGLLSTPAFLNLPEPPHLYWAVILFFFGSALVPWLYRKIRAGPTSPAQGNVAKDRDNGSKLDLLVFLSFASLVGYFRPRYLLVCYPLMAIMAAAFLNDLRGKYPKKIYTGLFAFTIALN
ncbi:MAG: ArnT family glycosyltransferase, partial [Candidatus Binatia bacterium]